jgi:hypothetical protein
MAGTKRRHGCFPVSREEIMSTLQIQDSFQPYYAGRNEPRTRRPASQAPQDGREAEAQAPAEEKPPLRRDDN